ncbi:ComF family protein [Xanthomarina sp. F2636L]|uniref:ComF family protein n=1 Tax=Xanthomarina sp. F2636L TaxID=2996018 RepID=UPI00225DDE6A|nr:phosphoribosyltransferase family protein [Xanthomarina sp. F2636L]MCX7551067.1 phosphoribosyltransferase family protein [Xanthomarina sp. F2636L]
MLKSVIDLFFPQVCFACMFQLGDNEKYVCTDCRHNLPVTNYHLENDDTVLKTFYGRAKIEHATALLRFEKKGITQQLMHNLKYKGHEDVGVFLGTWLGEELKELKDYQTIDAVIPVPLHKKKLRKRGYNQVAKFGQEIAKQLNTDYCDDVLIKVTNTSSQVNKNRFSRWSKNDELFAIQHKEKINNKHILLVDDLITTGATMEACISVLNKAQNVKISIASMAIA